MVGNYVEVVDFKLACSAYGATKVGSQFLVSQEHRLVMSIFKESISIKDLMQHVL